MKRYSIQFINLEKFQEYEQMENKEIFQFSSKLFIPETFFKQNTSKPLSFPQFGKERVKFTLEELDCITSLYSSRDDFIKTLSNLSFYQDYFPRYLENDLVVTHKRKDYYIVSDIVYRNPLLREYAYELRKKTEDVRRDKVILSESLELQSLYKRLLTYSKEEETRKKFMNSPYCDYVLKNDIRDYNNLSQKNFLGIGEVEDLKQIKQNTYYQLRKYKVLRGVLLFEDKNQDFLRKKFPEIDLSHQIFAKSGALFYNSIEQERRLNEENWDILLKMAEERENKNCYSTSTKKSSTDFYDGFFYDSEGLGEKIFSKTGNL